MRSTVAILLAAAAVLASGCGGDDAVEPAATAAPSAAAAAPATTVAATLAQVADVPEARRRLGFADLERLRAADLPVSADAVAARVLGGGATQLERLPAGAVRSAIRIGTKATILHGTGVPRDGGEPRGRDGVVLGGDPQLSARLAELRPERSAIAPNAPSAVQSCLGDSLAQTILGPETMGADAALGVGLAESGDAPAGIQLRICAAPHYRRHIHQMERRLERRFGETSGGPGRGARVEEHEIGEREIIGATIAADALPSRTLLALLAGGAQLRALAWR